MEKTKEIRRKQRRQKKQSTPRIYALVRGAGFEPAEAYARGFLRKPSNIRLSPPPFPRGSF